MGSMNDGLAADHEISVDAAWNALCADLEATARVVAGKFARTAQAHLSYTEVHELAQLVDLADDGQPLDGRLVEFAMQCLAQVADRAVRTRFRPKYFSDYRCLNALWEASARRRHRPASLRPQTLAIS
jgi:hypothetical protein